MRMRAVPFANLNERLYRIVRQTARELGKSAQLDIQGSQVELDRSVLERIGASLEHMLRNALTHGLEAPEARVAAGKPEAGRIAVGLRQEANEIALTVSDDGAGLDLEKLRRRALERGLLAAEASVSDADAAQLIFVSGLSTADAVTELAGRGVGMDVVRNEIGAIGGRVDIATARGHTPRRTSPGATTKSAIRPSGRTIGAASTVNQPLSCWPTASRIDSRLGESGRPSDVHSSMIRRASAA